MRVNEERKKKMGKAGGVAVRARTASNAELKRGGRGAERGSPRQKSKQRWLQERHFSATCRKKRNRISQEPMPPPLRRAQGCPAPGGAARPRQPLSVPGAFPAPSCAWEEEATNGVYRCSSRPWQPTNKRERIIAAQAGRRWGLCPLHEKAPQPHGPACGAAQGPGARAEPGSARAGTGPAKPPPGLGAAMPRTPRQGVPQGRQRGVGRIHQAALPG